MSPPRTALAVELAAPPPDAVPASVVLVPAGHAAPGPTDSHGGQRREATGPAARALSRARRVQRFFSLGLANFDRTASLVPSSKYLVNAMLAPVDFARVEHVVELGTGTGSLTDVILQRMHPGARLYGLELNADLLAVTRQRLPDPRLIALAADARELPAVLARAGAPPKVDAVISSLGLSMMDGATRGAILSAVKRVLGEEGVYMQYAYAHARYLAYSQDRRRFFSWHARPFIESRFADVEIALVRANLPPAYVFTCRRPW